jgi:hypothetical protein
VRRGHTDAETCALNGWGAGTRLVGDEGYGPTTIRITAVGERSVLAVAENRRGKRLHDEREQAWTLECREWREVEG